MMWIFSDSARYDCFFSLKFKFFCLVYLASHPILTYLISITLEIWCEYSQIQPGMTDYFLWNSFCHSTFIQAGLVMYASEFNAFVWEQEAKVLDLPYFYLGIYKFPFCCVVWINVIDILSLWHFGNWQWRITHSFYFRKFVWKNIFVEINSEMILYSFYGNYKKSIY